MDKDTIMIILAVITPILSGIGAWVGAYAQLAKLETKVENHEDEITQLRKRTHRHAGVLTLVAAKTGVTYQGDD
jgi:hypothetical protein